MPALAIVLGFLPFLARKLTNDPFVPAGMATAMIVLPIAWLLLTAWISAIVPDRIGAYVGRDALRRSMLGKEGE